MSSARRAPVALVVVVRAALAFCMLMLLVAIGGWDTGAAAADGAQGEPTLEPAAVPAATDAFSLVPPAEAHCADGGDARSGAEGWRWHTFIVEAGRDIATLDFGGTGPGTDLDATDGSITAGLIVLGRGIWNEPPAEQPKGLVNPNSLAGIVLDPADYTLRDGRYDIGFACTDEASVVRQWWSLEVTVQTAGAPFLTATRDAAPLSAGGDASTTTTVAGATAPTDAGSMTTVAGAAAATTTTAVGAAGATGAGAAVPPGPRGVSWEPLVVLVDTSSVLPIAVWAVLVLLLARAAYLLARPVRVLPPIAP